MPGQQFICSMLMANNLGKFPGTNYGAIFRTDDGCSNFQPRLGAADPTGHLLSQANGGAEVRSFRI
jgi:hypothetical protein